MSNDTPNLSKAFPPGVDPRAYMEEMVGKAEASGWYDKPAAAPTELPQPRVPTFSRHGSPVVAANARPGDVIEVDLGDGKLTTVEVEQAVALGMVTRRAGGGYDAIPDAQRDAERAATEQQRQEEQAERVADIEAKRSTGDEPSQETQSAIDTLTRALPGNVVTEFAEEYISKGELNAQSVLRTAEAFGMGAEQTRALVQTLSDGLYTQADTAIGAVGVPAEEADAAYTWMAANYPLEHKNATRSLIMGSNAQPLRDLAKRYVAWRDRHGQR